MRKNKSYAQIVKIGVITSCSAIFLLITILYLIIPFISNTIANNIHPLKTEQVIEDLKLDSLKLESESALQRNDKVDTPKEQSQDPSAESSNTHIFSGNSNNNTGHNATNGSSTTTQSNNPFGTGGDGGGNGSGSGTGFGNDAGNGGEGTGGNGSGTGRIRLNNLNTDHIKSSENATIYLTLTINAEGKVVSAKSISSKTTTTDTRLINQFISAVKDQIKYNKDPGAGLVSVYFSDKLIAN